MKTQLMKYKCLGLAVAALGSQLINAPTASAQDLYSVNLNAIGISTNAEGRIVYKEVNNRDIIKDVAKDQGLTNVMGLSLVYNVQASDIEVISGTNDTVIATPLTFSGGVSLTNTNGTQGQLLEYIYLNTNQVASGTLVANQQIRYGSTNQITSFNLQGQFQVAVPENGTNSAGIYLGNLSVEHRSSRPCPIIAPDPFGR